MNISKFGTTDNNSLSTPKVVGIENKVSKSGDTMLGDLNLNNHRITNLATPVTGSDSVNKEFLDNAISNLDIENKVSKSGDTMLGDLNLNNHIITNLATPVTVYDSVNKGFLDNAISNLEIENKISKSGDAMNGDLNLSNHRITNLATPVAVSDSVNKEFLDNAIRNLIRFEGTPTYGSKLAIMGVNNEGRHVASITPIQVQGNNIYGLQKLIRLPDDIFRIENYTDNNASIELSDTLILKGLANPTEPNDAATKEFVENLVSNVGDNIRISQNLDMNNYTIFNVGRPTKSTSAINKRYFKRNTYRPKFQIFLGASNSPASTDSSSTFHTVRTNVDHILKLVSPPLVSGNDILTF